jgi:hypothetical protein
MGRRRRPLARIAHTCVFRSVQHPALVVHLNVMVVVDPRHPEHAQVREAGSRHQQCQQSSTALAELHPREASGLLELSLLFVRW